MAKISEKKKWDWITTKLDKPPIFVPGNGNIIKNAVTYVSFIKITVIIPKIVLVAQTNFP